MISLSSNNSIASPIYQFRDTESTVIHENGSSSKKSSGKYIFQDWGGDLAEIGLGMVEVEQEELINNK